MSSDAEYVCEALRACEGARILGAVVGDSGFPALLVKGDRGTWWLDIQADAEGNGPGWVNVEAVPPPAFTLNP